MREHVKNLGKPEPEKKVRISVAVDQDFLALIDQIIEKGFSLTQPHHRWSFS